MTLKKKAKRNDDYYTNKRYTNSTILFTWAGFCAVGTLAAAGNGVPAATVVEVPEVVFAVVTLAATVCGWDFIK